MPVRFSTIFPCALAFGLLAHSAPAQDKGLDQAIEHARTIAPRNAKDFKQASLIEAMEKSCREIETQIRPSGNAAPNRGSGRRLETRGTSIVGKAQVDQLLDESFELRKGLVKDAADADRSALRSFLGIVGALIDLSGRLDYQLRDSINDAAFRVAGHRLQREKLLEILTRHRSSMGAEVMDLAAVRPAGQFRQWGGTGQHRRKTTGAPAYFR